MDKKKYLIRMQSKPSPSGAHLASLGNELNLDEGHDKLLTSSGSSSANEPAANAASALTASTSSSTCSSGPYTEILFKTKSSNEMKRLFGLLQWKDSLNYDDNVSVHISAYKPKNVHLHSFLTGAPATGQAVGRTTENSGQRQLSGRRPRWSECSRQLTLELPFRWHCRR